jgi:hypothetical protein
MRSKEVMTWPPKLPRGTGSPNGTICARMYRQGSLIILRTESALGAPEVGRSSLRCVINPRLKHRAHCRRSARLARSRAADGVSAELCVLDGLGSRTGSLGAAENRNLGVAGSSAATWKDSLIQFSAGGTGSKARP